MTTSAYGSAQSTDAVARYRYLLSTSSPEQIEKAHEEAFAAMTPIERQEVLAALARNGESPADTSSASLARSATRLEMRQPGSMSSLTGSLGGGGTVLASLAAGFVGSAVWSGLTGGDGVGGRPGLLSRLFGGGRRPGGLGGLLGGSLYGSGYGDDQGYGSSRGGHRGGFFGGGGSVRERGPGGPDGGSGGFGGPGRGGPGVGPGGAPGGPGGRGPGGMGGGVGGSF